MMVSIEVDDELLLDRNVWTALVRFRAGYLCEDCGSEGRMHAHHVNEDDEDNRLANGRCLCVACHGKRHPGWRSQRWEGTTAEERRAQIAPMVTARNRTRHQRCKPGCACGRHRKKVAT